jgi:hypothetical protein
MWAVARKQAVDDGGNVEPNTHEWRQRVNDELARRPRGTRARLAEYLKCSTGQLSDTLGPDKHPNEKRYTRLREGIDRFLWPPLMPITPDTEEVRTLLDGLRDANKDLLRVIKDMDFNDQRKLAELLLSQRRAKR